MTLPRIHLATGRDVVGLSLGRCGWMGAPARFTADEANVTCLICVRLRTRAAPTTSKKKSKALRRGAPLLLEVVAAQLEEIYAGPWPAVLETADATERRRLLIDQATSRALQLADFERRGVRERPPFAGPVAALRALDETTIDGASLRSTSDPARFEVAGWTMSSTGGGDQAQRDVERIAPVARAWATVLADGWAISAHPRLVALTADEARQVVVWAQLGLQGAIAVRQLFGPMAREQSTAVIAARGRYDEAGKFAQSPPEASDVAAYASRVWGVALPVSHVEGLRVRGLGEFYERLFTCGQVPRDERWKMVEPLKKPYDYAGWAEIGEALHMTPRRARKIYEEAKGTPSPMPLHLWRGVLHAKRAELQAWWDAQLERAAVAS